MLLLYLHDLTLVYNWHLLMHDLTLGGKLRVSKHSNFFSIFNEPGCHCIGSLIQSPIFDDAVQRRQLFFWTLSLCSKHLLNMNLLKTQVYYCEQFLKKSCFLSLFN